MKKIALTLLLTFASTVLIARTSSPAAAMDEEEHQDPTTEPEEGEGTHDMNPGFVICAILPTYPGCPEYITPAQQALCGEFVADDPFYDTCLNINIGVVSVGCRRGFLATAWCRDGAVSCAIARAGACSSHGGVEEWIE